jgi:hypothetical protein
VSESFGVSRDDAFLTLSAGQDSASIMEADGVPDAAPPAGAGRDPVRPFPRPSGDPGNGT